MASASDFGGRQPVGVVSWLVFGVAVTWALFQLYQASGLAYLTQFLLIDAAQNRSIHLAFTLFLGFLAYPMLKRHGGARPIPLIDWLLAFGAAFCALYIFLFYDHVARGAGGARTTTDLAVGVAGIICVLEITRRALGLPLVIICCLFIGYALYGPMMPDLIAHRGASVNRLIDHLWLTTEGVFGIALGVSTSIIFLFVLFGTLLKEAGSGAYLIKLSFALLGHLKGGPAKASVVASGLTGVLSGSAIANIVTTGTFTVPLMKRIGLPGYKAGAIETSSSINGQLMPPVMGAAAFIMTEFVGISYFDVIRHALLPALISYIALYYIVHLEALKHDLTTFQKRVPRSVLARVMSGLLGFIVMAVAALAIWVVGTGTKMVFGPMATYAGAIIFLVAYTLCHWVAARLPEIDESALIDAPDELPEVWPTFLSGLYFLLPIVVLIWCLIVERLSAGLSVLWAIGAQSVVMVTREALQNALRGQSSVASDLIAGVVTLINGMAMASRNMVGVAIAMAAAGIIVGTVSLTGLGMTMTSLVETAAGGNLLLVLILTAVICVVLGMGLPTTANYIVVVAVMGPVIVELAAGSGLVVPLIAVHLFVFYFGLLSGTTPPVAIDAFVGAAVAKADPLKTSLQSFYYSTRTAILPFIFLFNTELLLIGIQNVAHLVMTVVASVVAMLVFAAATQHFMITRNRVWETVALLLVAFTLLRPSYWLDRIYDPYISVDPVEIHEVAENRPTDGTLRLQVSGMDLAGRDVDKVVLFQLGERGPSGEERLLNSAGLVVDPTGDQVNVTRVDFNTPGQLAGIQFGWSIDGVQIATDRPAKHWFYIPALLLAALIVALQLRRRRAEGAGESTAAFASGQTPDRASNPVKDH